MQRHIGEQGGRPEIAGAAHTLAAGQQGGALCQRIADKAFHRQRPARVGERAHLGGGIEAGADGETLGTLRHGGGKAIGNGFVHDQAGGGDADLAGVAPFEGRNNGDGLFDIAVIPHDHRAVAAQFHGGALGAVSRQPHQMLAHRHGAGEADLADDRAGNEVARDRVGHAEHHRGDAGGQGGIKEALQHQNGRARRFFGRLDDHRTTGGQRGGELARRVEDREVPRAQRQRRPDRFVDDQAALPGGAGEHAAIVAAHFAGVEIDQRGAVR